MQQNKHGLIAAKVGNRAKRDPLSSSACPKARVAHPLQLYRKGWERISLPIALALLLTPALTQAQWDIQDAHTTASLRGIDNVGGGVAWACGTDGTILRTEDGGYLWQGCAIPPGAEHLDFRGIQAFDEQHRHRHVLRQRRPLPPLQNHRRLPHLETPLHQPRQRRLLGRHQFWTCTRCYWESTRQVSMRGVSLGIPSMETLHSCQPLTVATLAREVRARQRPQARL